MSAESRELLAMRAIEWERAKGSLQAILAACWTGAGEDSFYHAFKAEVEKFIAVVEDDHGWF